MDRLRKFLRFRKGSGIPQTQECVSLTELLHKFHLWPYSIMYMDDAGNLVMHFGISMSIICLIPIWESLGMRRN